MARCAQQPCEIIRIQFNCLPPAIIIPDFIVVGNLQALENKCLHLFVVLALHCCELFKLSNDNLRTAFYPSYVVSVVPWIVPDYFAAAPCSTIRRGLHGA